MGDQLEGSYGYHPNQAHHAPSGIGQLSWLNRMLMHVICHGGKNNNKQPAQEENMDKKKLNKNKLNLEAIAMSTRDDILIFDADYDKLSPETKKLIKQQADRLRRLTHTQK